MATSDEGWAEPTKSRKYHYFRNGRSLCGRWGFFGELQGDEPYAKSECDCRECWRRREKEWKAADALKGNGDGD